MTADGLRGFPLIRFPSLQVHSRTLAHHGVLFPDEFDSEVVRSPRAPAMLGQSRIEFLG